MAGRYPGIKLSFETAYRVACEYFEYWTAKGDGGAWVAWHDGVFLGAASSEAAARNLVVRDFAKAIGLNEGAYQYV